MISEDLTLLQRSVLTKLERGLKEGMDEKVKVVLVGDSGGRTTLGGKRNTTFQAHISC